MEHGVNLNVCRGGKDLCYKMKCELCLLLSGVHQQAEADQDDQQVNVRGLVPGFVHRVVDGLVLVAQNPVCTHVYATTTPKPCG